MKNLTPVLLWLSLTLFACQKDQEYPPAIQEDLPGKWVVNYVIGDDGNAYRLGGEVPRYLFIPCTVYYAKDIYHQYEFEFNPDSSITYIINRDYYDRARRVNGSILDCDFTYLPWRTTPLSFSDTSLFKYKIVSPNLIAIKGFNINGDTTQYDTVDYSLYNGQLVIDDRSLQYRKIFLKKEK